MLSRIKVLLENLSPESRQPIDTDRQIRLAAAVLLVEVMMADHEISASEKARLNQSLRNMFDMNDAQVAALIDEAEQKHDVLVSLQEVTNIINMHFDPVRKTELLLQMWRIAYADSEWDKYEEHLIRKVADLLYVSHKDFIRCKHLAQTEET